ncbi:unnamed protein product [Somion occarium]|uniref:Mif2/CENP-C cupin domain-containing protein n=1 Tax=Somion occarium TaxID=3059160 RepID=A0ABP1DC32_9APHY
MPTSVRKSSIGTSRPIPQKYIPYHADNYERGKRTGISVDYVETSDDFEPFDKVLSQADKRTPPRPKIQKKKRRPKTPKTPIVEEEEFDEDGEMSMELEDSTPRGPSAYFSAARVAITSSLQKAGSSSRPVHRSSDMDYDSIPSPRAGSSSAFLRRQSIANGGRSSHASRLSQSTVAHEDFDEPMGAFDDVPGPPSSDDSDNEPMISPPRKISRRTSFQQLDRDEDDHDREEEQQVDTQITGRSPASAKARGKQRQLQSPEPPEIDIENDFDIDMPMDDEPPPEEEPQEEASRGKKSRRREPSPVREKPKKKARKENDGQTVSRKRNDGILQEVIQDSNVEEHPEGVRRSRRARFAPLEYWRMEKVVYGRPEHGKAVLPVVKEILRVPKENPKPLGAKKKRRTRAKSQTAEIAEDAYNPEEGWDEGTKSYGMVWSVTKNEEVNKRVVHLQGDFKPRPATGGGFEFEKIFGDETFIAAGQIKIAPKQSKPTKSTKDNTFVFFVVQGAVDVHIHQTLYRITTGGSFMVPRGNVYHIRNAGRRDAILFFAQARKIKEGTEPVTDAEAEQTDGESRSRSRSRSNTLVQKGRS